MLCLDIFITSSFSNIRLAKFSSILWLCFHSLALKILLIIVVIYTYHKMYMFTIFNCIVQYYVIHCHCETNLQFSSSTNMLRQTNRLSVISPAKYGFIQDEQRIVIWDLQPWHARSLEQGEESFKEGKRMLGGL